MSPIPTRKREKHPLGQVFTPRPVADLMVSMSQAKPDNLVLEPCAGQGVFIDALVDGGFKNVEALEFDERLVEASSHAIRSGSFVSASFSEEFDLIIGNPPYIRWRDLDPILKEELQSNPLWIEHFNSLSDYLTIFIARSVELLREGGELIFITPSFWLHTQHSGFLRDFMLEKGYLSHIIHFGEANVFPRVATSIVIFRFVRHASSLEAPDIRLWRYQGARKVDLSSAPTYADLDRSDDFEALKIPPFHAGRPWVLATAQIQDRLSDFEAACAAPEPFAGGKLLLFEDVEETSPVRLGDIAEIANGMVSGLDAAFRIPDDLELSNEETDSIILVPKGANVGRYCVSDLTRYIFVTEDISSDEFEEIYPNFAAHLAPYRERLDARYAYGRDLKYWQWAFLRSIKFFQAAEALIVTPCKQRLSHRSFLRFALAPRASYPTQDVSGIGLLPDTRESPEFILSQLNHPRMFEWVIYKGLMKGSVAEFSERPLSRMPIRLIDWQDQAEVALHDEITSLVKSSLMDKCEPDIDQISQSLDKLLWN